MTCHLGAGGAGGDGSLCGGDGGLVFGVGDDGSLDVGLVVGIGCNGGLRDGDAHRSGADWR